MPVAASTLKASNTDTGASAIVFRSAKRRPNVPDAPHSMLFDWKRAIRGPPSARFGTSVLYPTRVAAALSRPTRSRPMEWGVVLVADSHRLVFGSAASTGERYCVPSPGQMLLFGGNLSEPELLIPYGPSRFASKAGLLAGNPVLTIEDRLTRLQNSADRFSGVVPWTSVSSPSRFVPALRTSADSRFAFLNRNSLSRSTGDMANDDHYCTTHSGK